MKQTKILNKKYRDIILIVISSIVASINIAVFVDSAGLFPGGFSGIAFFISRFALKYFQVAIPFGYIYILLNLLPVVFVYKYIGKKFTILSLLQVFLVSVMTNILPVMQLTDDIILVSIFGGIFSGIAIALALEANASCGGTDFIAVYFAKNKNMPTWNYVLFANSIILVIAGCFFGWDKALYSIIFQFTTTQVINMMHLRYQRAMLFIITENPDILTPIILKKTHHGVTKFIGEGGFTGKTKYLLYTVVSAFEVDEVLSLCKEVDPKVFVNVSKSEKIMGRFYQIPFE